MHRFRSVFAVLAGLATIIALSNGIDTVLESTGIFPSLDEQRSHGFNTPWMLLLALSYRVVFAFVGGRLTAVLSPSGPNKHVAAPVILGFVLGLAGTVASWGFTPAWFALAILGLTPAAAWLGGHEREPALSLPRREPAACPGARMPIAQGGGSRATRAPSGS